MKMIKKYIRFFLICIALLLFFADGAVLSPIVLDAEAAEVVFQYNNKQYRRSKDVPAIYIEDARGVNVQSYVNCSVVAIDKVGGKLKDVVDTKSTVRIRGNSTSSGAKKPYNIKFSADTDLFGMGKGKRFCLIANMYDPTLIRNHMVFSFAKDLGLQYTLDSMLVDVYFNGTYVGCYQLCEAATADKARVDIDCKNGDYIIERDARTDAGTTYITTSLGHRFGINEPEDTTPSQKRAIEEHLRKAEAAVNSRNFEEVRKYFDIESIIDSYICLEYFKNVDIVVGSTRFYCKDGIIYGGPVWDYDLSTGNCSSTYYVDYNNHFGDSAEGIWGNHIWYDDLMLIPEYKQAVYDRYLEIQDLIINLYRDNVLGKNAIDRIIESASVSIERNFKQTGWRPYLVYTDLMRIPDQTYEENVEYLRAWLERRNNWLLNNWGIADRVQPKLANSSLRYIGGLYLMGIKPETSVADVQALFAEKVKINTEGAIICTGDALKGASASYFTVVQGDLNGDGLVTPLDYILLKQHLAGEYELNPAAKYAARADGKAVSEKSAEKIKHYCIYGKFS